MLRLQKFTQAVLTLRLGGAQVDTSGAQAREYSEAPLKKKKKKKRG